MADDTCRHCGNAAMTDGYKRGFCSAGCRRLFHSGIPCAGGCGQLVAKSRGSLVNPICRSCRGVARKQKVKVQTCDRCGSTFERTVNLHRTRRYCSRACANQYERVKKAPSRPSRTCEQCGVTFRQAGGHPQRFCSRPCSNANRTRTARKPRRLSDVRTLIWVKDCKRCAKTFVSTHPSKVFCTVACRVCDNAERLTSLYAMAVEHGGPGGARWRKSLCELLAERDGPDCGICGEYVNPNLPSGPKGSDQGPSVDHIQPRSHGGRDELTNLRLTHWGCNRDRGNRWQPPSGVADHTAA